MGQSELLTAIRRKGEEQAAAINRSADEELEAVRLATAARCEELRLEHGLRLATAGAERHHNIVAEAARQAALIRLRAEHGLALRLRERAGTCLGQLRESDDGRLLSQLAEELPRAEWATIRVAPADTAQAAGLFPRAAIEADPAISGGLVAVTADNSLTVVNTLESRLEKGWPDLLPELLDDLREELS